MLYKNTIVMGNLVVYFMFFFCFGTDLTAYPIIIIIEINLPSVAIINIFVAVGSGHMITRPDPLVIPVNIYHIQS